MNAILRINFDQKVHVIRHDFHLEYICTVLSADALDNFFKPRINTVDQHEAAILRTPHHIVCARVNDVVV